MNTKLRNHIRANFSARDTEELLKIWKTNDRVEWSDMAFEVLGEILKERLDVLPEQGEPIHAHEETDGLEEWQAKVIDSEEQPEIYDTVEVVDAIANIDKVARAVVIVYALTGVMSSYAFEAIAKGAVSFSDMDQWLPVLWNLFTTVLSTAIQIAVVYFPLKALAHILRILMEMEFNSRKIIGIK